MISSLHDIQWQCYPWENLSTTLLYAILSLRQEVFVVEQNCPYLDTDGKDTSAVHLVGMHGEYICCYARIFPPNEEGHIVIGRVIVAPRYRSLGYGYALMNKAHEYALTRFSPHKTIAISAQAHLKRFYEHVGYQQSGEGYLEDDIPHIPMIRL